MKKFKDPWPWIRTVPDERLVQHMDRAAQRIKRLAELNAPKNILAWEKEYLFAMHREWASRTDRKLN